MKLAISSGFSQGSRSARIRTARHAVASALSTAHGAGVRPHILAAMYFASSTPFAALLALLKAINHVH